MTSPRSTPSNLQRQLNISLPEASTPAGATFDPVVRSEPVAFEAKLFNVDIVGIGNFFYRQLYRGDTVRVLVEVLDSKVRYFVEVTRPGKPTGESSRLRRPDGHGRSASGTRARRLRHRIDLSRRSPRFSGMSSEVFCDFLGALGGFQSFVTETAAAARRGAQFAPALLNNIIKEFESRTLVELGAPVVHTLRASLYKLRGDLDQAIATLEQARELAPGDLFVAENLPKWREERTARIKDQAELAARPVAGAPGIEPAVLATNYEAVRNQDALQQVAYPALMRAAAGDRAAPIVVAILSTGYTPGVEPPGPAATIRPVMNLVAGEGPEDGNGHGTTVTNLMAALIPFAEVELLPVKVPGASGGGQLTDIQAGFDRSVELAECAHGS